MNKEKTVSKRAFSCGKDRGILTNGKCSEFYLIYFSIKEKMSNRREFLKQSTGLLGLSALDFTAPANPLLSFSTLGCPAWTFSQALQYATANDYQGIEIRGIKGDLDLPNNPLFSASNFAQTKREITDSQIKIVNLGSSANMHFIDAKSDKVT